MRPHHNLDAWGKAIELVTAIYKRTEAFPKDERYSLTSQIRRAAISIAANIAEGAGRRSRKEFGHFLSNSQGSASELETELIIAHKLGYFDERSFGILIAQLELISKLIRPVGSEITASGFHSHLPFTIYYLPFTSY